MNVTVSNPPSPLQQARQSRSVATEGASRLSQVDQAVLKEILTGKYDLIDNDVFRDPDAERKIFDDAPSIRRPDVSWYHPVMDNVTDSPGLKNNGTVLLTAAEERTLFLQFNYCRYRVIELREKISKASRIRTDDARELLRWHRRAERYREQIAETNLALVLAMAKRTRMSEIDFADMVSEGNMALLRAVDKFDVARGFKFSTYACRAILKAFSRSGIKHSRYRQLFPTDFDPKLERSDFMEKKRDSHNDDCADEIRLIIEQNRAELTEIEQEVIEHRFSLSQNGPRREVVQPLTLEQVGKIIGVTKERVRQIQNKALEKIRQTLEHDFLN